MKPIKIYVPRSLGYFSLHGEITSLSSNDIYVKMLSPYSISGERHIAYYVRPYVVQNNQRYTNTDETLSDYGRKTAEDLLKRLFDYGFNFRCHLEEIEKEYALYQQSVEEIGKKHLSDELYREKRKEMRKQLRAGALDLKVYDKTLYGLRKQNNKYSYEVYCVQREFEQTVQKLCCTKHYLPVMDLVNTFLKESNEHEGTKIHLPVDNL